MAVEKSGVGRVVPAGSGPDALYQIELSQHTIDLVICDLFMPEMEGLETMGHIRQRHGELKIIAISGGGRAAAQQSYLEDA